MWKIHITTDIDHFKVKLPKCKSDEPAKNCLFFKKCIRHLKSDRFIYKTSEFWRVQYYALERFAFHLNGTLIHKQPAENNQRGKKRDKIRLSSLWFRLKILKWAAVINTRFVVTNPLAIPNVGKILRQCSTVISTYS